MAQLVNNATAAGAKAIGFDVVFSEPDESAHLQTIDNMIHEIKKVELKMKT